MQCLNLNRKTLLYNWRQLSVIACILASASLASCGQEVDSQDNVISSSGVPQVVQSAFANKYPGKTPTWELQPYGYEAVFAENGIEYEAEYSSNGQWLETEYELTSDNGFSSVVLDKVRAQYPSGTIKKREIEITPQGIFYEVEVVNNDNEVELYFDDRGNRAQNSHEDA
jgi:Putative beta-lactamase-inhibitor-like, PepSY-like